MIDTHVHLSYRYFKNTFPYIFYKKDDFGIIYGDRNSLISEMKATGISCCIEPATDVDSNRLLLELSHENPGYIYPAVGNHPTRCIRSSLKDFKIVKECAKDESVVAIGETGLDYHYDRKDQHRIRQRIWFEWQINLADKLRLPLILHIRMADDDAIAVLRNNQRKLHGGVCHCFGGGAEVAKVYTEELGLYLGIGGTLLMRPEISEALMDTVRNTDIKYIVLETDGPYVKPSKPGNITKKKWRKARNTSLILPAVAQKIADIKGMDVMDVIEISDANARRLFGITPV